MNLIDPLEISYASSKLNGLLSDWSNVERTIDHYRLQRFKYIDVEAARRSNPPTLLENEIAVIIRAIERSISMAKPAYLGYLRGNSNLVMFINAERPAESYEDLEIAFDRGMKYPNWDKPFVETIDCCLAHGIGAVEVLYDQHAPLHVSVEYICKRDLIFHVDTKEIQQQQYVMRRYEWPKPALQANAAAFGFDPEVVEQANVKYEGNCNVQNFYKVYIKTTQGLFIAWWSDADKSKWLKPPEPYRVGFAEAETVMPIFILAGDILEDSRLLSLKGLCFKMDDIQVATTAIWSAVVNTTNLAASPIFSPKNIISESQEKPFVMKQGYVTRNPLEMHVMAFPSAELLNVAERMRLQATEDVGQVQLALMNKKNPKTAAEIHAGEALQANTNAISVLNLSNFIRVVYTYAWRIVQNEAMADRVNLLGDYEQSMTGLVYVNDKKRIAPRFLILAAGDREAMRRAEVQQAFQEILPLVRGTPLEKIILQDMMAYNLPMMGQRYKQVFAQSIASQDMTLQIMQGFLERIQEANSQPGVQPGGPVNVQFTPEEAQALAQTYAQYQQIYGATPGGAPPMENQPANNSAPPEPQIPGGGFIPG